MKTKIVIYIFILIALMLSTLHIVLDSNHSIICYIGFILVIIGFFLIGIDYLRHREKC